MHITLSSKYEYCAFIVLAACDLFALYSCQFFLLEPHSKKSETLFSFMHDPETETTPFQSHSNTDYYLAVPCVFVDTNLTKY